MTIASITNGNACSFVSWLIIDDLRRCARMFPNDPPSLAMVARPQVYVAGKPWGLETAQLDAGETSSTSGEVMQEACHIDP